MEVIQKGFYDSGTGQHQSNTVYSVKGLCPTITTITGGGTIQIKILKRLDKVAKVTTIPESKAKQSKAKQSKAKQSKAKQSKAKHCRVVGSMSGFESGNRVYDIGFCCPTISTCQGGNRQPKVLRKWKRE